LREQAHASKEASEATDVDATGFRVRKSKKQPIQALLGMQPFEVAYHTDRMKRQEQNRRGRG